MTFLQSILELCSAEEADAGQYSCFADNTFGNDTASFVLTVNAQSKLCNNTLNEYDSFRSMHIYYAAALLTFALTIKYACGY